MDAEKKKRGSRLRSKKVRSASGNYTSASSVPTGSSNTSSSDGGRSAGSDEDEADWEDADDCASAGSAAAASPVAAPPHAASGYSPGAKAAVGLASEMNSSRLHGAAVPLRAVGTWEVAGSDVEVDSRHGHGNAKAATFAARAMRASDALRGTRQVLQGMTPAQRDTVGVAVMSAFDMTRQLTLERMAEATAAILGPQFAPTAPRKRPPISKGRMKVAYFNARRQTFHNLPKRLRVAIVNSKPLQQLTRRRHGDAHYAQIALFLLTDKYGANHRRSAQIARSLFNRSGAVIASGPGTASTFAPGTASVTVTESPLA